jgi:hypothetical protein
VGFAFVVFFSDFSQFTLFEMGGDGDLTGTRMRRSEVTALGDASSQDSQDSQDDSSLKCEGITQSGKQCKKNKAGSSRFCRQHAAPDLISDDDDDSALRHSKKRRISSSNDSDDNTTVSDDDSDYDDLLRSLAPLMTLQRGAISAAEELASISTTWDAAASELPLSTALFKDLQAMAKSPATSVGLLSTLLDNLLTQPITITSRTAELARPFNVCNDGLVTPLCALVHKTHGDGRLTPLPLLEQVLWYARTVISSDDSRAQLLDREVDEGTSIIDSPAELQTLIVPRLHRIILNTIAGDVQQNGIINSMVGFPRQGRNCHVLPREHGHGFARGDMPSRWHIRDHTSRHPSEVSRSEQMAT